MPHLHKTRPAHAVEFAPLDAIDRDILRLLVGNARMSFRELGEHVGLSANAVADRVRRLNDRGVIVGYRAVLDPEAAGRRLVALVDIRLANPSDGSAFERLVDGLDPVTDVWHVTGRFDYGLRVACGDPAELDGLLRTLKAQGRVAESDTRIALRTIVRR